MNLIPIHFTFNSIILNTRSFIFYSRIDSYQNSFYIHRNSIPTINSFSSLTYDYNILKSKRNSPYKYVILTHKHEWAEYITLIYYPEDINLLSYIPIPIFISNTILFIKLIIKFRPHLIYNTYCYITFSNMYKI